MMYTVAAVAMRVASKRCMLLIGDVIKYVAVMVATDMSMNGAISLIAEPSGKCISRYRKWCHRNVHDMMMMT